MLNWGGIREPRGFLILCPVGEANLALSPGFRHSPNIHIKQDSHEKW